MSWVLLFAGQGRQHAEMLSWVDGQPESGDILGALAQQLGADWRQRLADADWGSDNRVAQTLLTGLGLAAWQALAPRLPAPAWIAGYSVGELAAASAAGAFGAEEALRLAGKRAECMSHAAQAEPTGMLAVTGPREAAVADICARLGLDVALILASDKHVLGGPVTVIDLAAAELEAQGAGCQKLAIQLASHTRWMAPALTDWAQALAATPFARPQTGLVCNLTGQPVRSEVALRHALVEQIAQPVQWAATMETLAERRPRCVLEIGPGNSLSKLWNEQQRGAMARSADEFRSAGAVVEWVQSQLGSAA
jgi:[acyl-carrier-protein] S-malonyltransferase